MQPAPTTIQWSNDAATGQLATMTREDGSRIDYTYDSRDAGRLVSVAVTGGAAATPPLVGTTAQTFTYDGPGHRIASTDNNIATDSTDDADCTWAYDSLGRMVEEGQQIGSGPVARVSHAFVAGDEASLVYPNDRTLHLAYHYPGGPLKQVGDDGALTAIAQFDYLGGRTLLRQSPGGGTNLDFRDSGGAALFDATGRPTKWLFRNPAQAGSPAVVGYEFTYDANGNKMSQKSLHDPLDSQRYAYDSADRLTSFVRGPFGALPQGFCGPSTDTWQSVDQYEGWDLDGVGNWSQYTTRQLGQAPTVEQRTEDTVNAYATVGATTLQHDANGNMTRDELGRTLKWDGFNRLREVYSTTGTLIARYSNDSGNRRMRKALGPGARAGTPTDYKWSGWRAVEESAPTSSTPHLQRLYGNYLDEILCEDTNRNGDSSCIGAGDRRTFPLQTDLYSLAATWDQSANGGSGGIVEAFEYNPYGPTTCLSDGTGPATVVSFGPSDARVPFDYARPGQAFAALYGGHRADEETGLVDMRDRLFDTNLAGFASQDPTGYQNGTRLTEYLAGNPCNGTDLLGLWKRENWTSDGGIAIAEPCDDLETLADDITGHYQDWASFGRSSPWVNGSERVDVTRLLSILEYRLRKSVVADTTTFDAHFGPFQPSVYGFSESQVLSFFSGTRSGQADCREAFMLVFAKGLIDNLKPGEFDALKFHPGTPLADGSANSVSSMKIGDRGYFWNFSDYTERHPHGAWTGENVIKVGENSFWGFPGANPQSYGMWLRELLYWYNFNLPESQQRSDLPPGFIPMPTGVLFLDVPKVGMNVFDLREKKRKAGTQ